MPISCDSPREERATKLDLKEDLGIENLRSRVEWSTRDTRVDMIGCSDRVRAKESDNLSRSEATSIVEASENRSDRVCFNTLVFANK